MGTKPYNAHPPSHLDGLITLHVEAYFAAHEGLPPPGGLYDRIIRAITKPLILKTLELADGNQVKAAEILGIHRNTLRKKIQDMDLNPERSPR